jgi:putative tricarboxylic transport membrane protein
MTISHGDPMVFVERPISAILLVVAMAVLAIAFIPDIAKRRKEVFVEQD